MKEDETGEALTGAIAGLGVMMLGFTAIGSLQPSDSSEPPAEQPPAEPPPATGDDDEEPGNDPGGQPPDRGTVITGASWQEVEYRFDWYGEDRQETTEFYKGEISISSDRNVVGKIAISCGQVIAGVPLLTEDGFQAMLRELDGLIAGSTGRIQEIWRDRKAIAQGFTRVDGFRIDWRWWDVDSWDRRFFEDYMMGRAVDVYYWNDVSIPQGTSTIPVGFFKKFGMAISGQAQVTLIIDGVAVSSVLCDLVSPGDYPAVRSLDVPASVRSGNDFDIGLSLYLPEEMPGSEWAVFTLSIDPGDTEGGCSYTRNFMSAALARTRNEILRRDWYIPMDAEDDVYDLTIPARAEMCIERSAWRGGDYYQPMPKGKHDIWASISIWRVGASDGGLYIYSETPVKYKLGIVGSIEVT